MPQRWTTFFAVILVCAALLPNELSAQAYVEGLVVSRTGVNIPAATVVIVRQDGGSGGATSETRSDGKFDAILLAPGNYTISASAEGYDNSQKTVVGFSMGRNRPIQITLDLLVASPFGRLSVFNTDGTARTLTIHVGPQVRDGFKDIDRDIRDSIRDIQDELRSTEQFVPVSTREEAVLRLEILGRGVTGANGAIATPLFGGGALAVSINERSVVARLTVGSYETYLIGEAGSWSESADEVVEHLLVWTDANRQRISEVIRTK